jgi:hypothetical protein
MKWIKLEIGNLPEHEVLAANFAKETYGYKEKSIGYVFDNGEMISCDATELLENCTHYIDINKHDIE